MPSVSIFGTTISNSDIWAGLLMLSAPLIITLCCFIARGGRVEYVVGILIIVVFVLCIGGAAR